MRYKSLRTEMMVNILGVTIVIMAVTLAVVAFKSINTARETARETSSLIASDVTRSVASYLEKPFETLYNINVTFSSLKLSGIKNREVYKDVLKKTLDFNPNYALDILRGNSRG
jgi:Na+/H+-translocating membrane pyrophosphatase